MKLGFGLYRHMLDRDHLRFAKQCGATHVVVHLVDYFNQAGGHSDQPVGGGRGGGWGVAGNPAILWQEDDLRGIKTLIESEGLEWFAIENFDPAHWYDVLLDGPEKKRQLDGLRQMISCIGRVGIPVIGYNFSLAGVHGRTTGPYARGSASSVGMEGVVDQTPLPDSMVWNMTLQPSVAGTGERTRILADELWRRHGEFLDEVLPAAEAAGVLLAAHPDDPPVERIRDTPRLVWRKDLYRQLVDLHSSRSNCLEFCLGTLAEMPDGDLYDLTATFARERRIAYVHCRNVIGHAPEYREVFIDEGQIDVPRILNILREANFDGVIIPDHAPQMSCAAPWHAGMAFTMGYLKALMG